MRWRRIVGGVSHAAFLCSIVAGCGRPLGERCLPATRGGLTRLGPVRRFTPHNLYDAINGEAPLVISFGFRSLAQADYGREGGEPLLSVDLYDMGCEDNAFALFRAHVTLESKPLDIGAEGAGDDTRVEFWQGRFCAVVNSLPSDKPFSAQAIARPLARDLPPTRAWPSYLERLPAEHRIPRSEQYAPRDFLGHPFLEDTVSARYKLGGREVMAFVCGYDSEDAAAGALLLLDVALQKHKPTSALRHLGHEGRVGEVPVLGPIAVFRRGRFLGGMVPYANDPSANGLLKTLERRLERP